MDEVAATRDKLRIYLNTNITMSRGKAAAHAVHAALTAFGVHPDVPVVVLGAKPRDIALMRTSIHDHGTTELEPGTLTAGTDWPAISPSDLATEADYAFLMTHPDRDPTELHNDPLAIEWRHGFITARRSSAQPNHQHPVSTVEEEQ